MLYSLVKQLLFLSGSNDPVQSGPGNDDNEGVLRIPQVQALLEAHN